MIKLDYDHANKLIILIHHEIKLKNRIEYTEVSEIKAIMTCFRGICIGKIGLARDRETVNM